MVTDETVNALLGATVNIWDKEFVEKKFCVERKPVEKQCIFVSSNTPLRSLLLRPLLVKTTASGVMT